MVMFYSVLLVRGWFEENKKGMEGFTRWGWRTRGWQGEGWHREDDREWSRAEWVRVESDGMERYNERLFNRWSIKDPSDETQYGGLVSISCWWIFLSMMQKNKWYNLHVFMVGENRSTRWKPSWVLGEHADITLLGLRMTGVRNLDLLAVMLRCLVLATVPPIERGVGGPVLELKTQQLRLARLGELPSYKGCVLVPFVFHVTPLHLLQMSGWEEDPPLWSV